MAVAVIMVVVMLMLVVMPVIVVVAAGFFVNVLALLFFAVHRHLCVGPPDAALLRLFRCDLRAGDPQSVQPGKHSGGIRMELQQRCSQHIPGCTHITLKI